jgi:hypothetical protein
VRLARGRSASMYVDEAVGLVYVLRVFRRWPVVSLCRATLRLRS